jgi:uncharacterized protein YdhG (YjbR/CyaY superfamily)
VIAPDGRVEQDAGMTAAGIDDYLVDVPEPARATLGEVRRRIGELVPSATEGISYGVPAFLIDGVPIAGLAAFRHHLSYLPHSGHVLEALGPLVDGYPRTPGSLHFRLDEPLPVDLLRALLAAKAELMGLPPEVVRGRPRGDGAGGATAR